MVATYTPYATIEEAWGEPSKDDKKKKRFDDIFESFGEDLIAAPCATNQSIREAAAPIPAPPPQHNDADECAVTGHNHVHGQRVYHLPKGSFEDRTEGRYLNFAMYVFSGVILIFVMEHFIQIGLAMRGSR